jgi:hypothetical protein
MAPAKDILFRPVALVRLTPKSLTERQQIVAIAASNNPPFVFETASDPPLFQGCWCITGNPSITD